MKPFLKREESLKEVLIIGGDSKIGTHLRLYFTRLGYSVTSTTRRKLDSRSSLSNYHLDLSSDMVKLPPHDFATAIICAGITEISHCEKYPDASKKINVQNTVKVIESLVKRNTHVIFLSSNSVFDGSKQFYKYNDEPSPKSKYGSYKLLVESYSKDLNFSILRLTKVLSYNSSFIEKWEKSLHLREKIIAYTNHFISPVKIETVAEVISQIMDAGIYESIGIPPRAGRQQRIFQLGADYEISYFDFALKHFEKNISALSLITGKSDGKIFHNNYNSLTTHLPTIK